MFNNRKILLFLLENKQTLHILSLRVGVSLSVHVISAYYARKGS